MTLQWVGSKPHLSELLEDLVEVLAVTFPGGQVYDAIVLVGNSVILVGLQDDVHQPLKCSWCSVGSKHILPVFLGSTEQSLGSGHGSQ